MLLDSFIFRKPRRARSRVQSPREQLRRRIEGILFGS